MGGCPPAQRQINRHQCARSSLEIAEGSELKPYLMRENALLESYGWINRTPGLFAFLSRERSILSWSVDCWKT
jgi:hypothetical protein